MQKILTQIIKKRSASDQRHQTEKVQNVLEHFAGDDIANKANILANIVDKEGSECAALLFSKSKALKNNQKLTPDQTASVIAGANLPDRAVAQIRTACNNELGTNPFASRHKVEEAREKNLVIKREDWVGSLCTSFFCIFNPFLEVFFLPHILHL